MTPLTVAVFDLDRTVTRTGTYTPFLLHCLPATPATWVRASAGIFFAAAYAAKFMSRSDVKVNMLKLSIAGASRGQVAAWSEAFAGDWLARRLRPGARAAIKRHCDAGHHLVLATASFDFYAGVFAQRLGFDHLIATASLWDQGDRLLPALGGENCYGPAKLAAVRDYVSGLAAKPRIVAYSDHHSDFDLLRWADEGVAVNPNGKLRRMAQSHSLAVVDWNAA